MPQLAQPLVALGWDAAGVGRAGKLFRINQVAWPLNQIVVGHLAMGDQPWNVAVQHLDP